VTGREYFASAENELRAMRPSSAMRAFDAAERCGHDPDRCSAGRWTCHMLRGEFETAWRESDRISARGRPDRNRFWDGTPIDGRSVIVRCLHGLGDTLQFIRYARLIRKQALSLIIEAQPPLKDLLAQAQIADEVTTWGEQAPSWNQQIEIVELPRIFRTTLETVPDCVPYLDVASETTAPSVIADPDGPLRIGLVWASGSHNSARSIPLRQMRPLFTIPRARFYSLQAPPERCELQPWTSEVRDFYERAASPLDAAKTLKSLDLLLTVDTMMAHLAGAMGRPVWMLLPFACDWRWMLDRADSPWYPTMRIFRQPQPGDWASVIVSVEQELRKLVTARPAAPAALAR